MGCSLSPKRVPRVNKGRFVQGWVPLPQLHLAAALRQCRGSLGAAASLPSALHKCVKIKHNHQLVHGLARDALVLVSPSSTKVGGRAAFLWGQRRAAGRGSRSSGGWIPTPHRAPGSLGPTGFGFPLPREPPSPAVPAAPYPVQGDGGRQQEERRQQGRVGRRGAASPLLEHQQVSQPSASSCCPFLPHPAGGKASSQLNCPQNADDSRKQAPESLLVQLSKQQGKPAAHQHPARGSHLPEEQTGPNLFSPQPKYTWGLASSLPREAFFLPVPLQICENPGQSIFRLPERRLCFAVAPGWMRIACDSDHP